MQTRFIVIMLFSFLFLSGIEAQKNKNSIPVHTQVDTSMWRSLQWRSIGPFRGGRSASVTGVKGKPSLYYFGSTGGGVWRTKDGGQSWANISDGFFGGSVGAIEVSSSDPNVIYVGGGEATVRGNVSYGYGMWRSTDAGATWEKAGLEKSKHIPRVRVHPNNPDIVYAAVLGDLFNDTKERGIYKSIDGGRTWKQTLFVNERSGAIDLIMDPNNARVMYASTWRVHRNPYELSSGGEGSAIWKSKDGGETWENISGHKGLPKGIWGISGITISPVNSNRLWAIIENENGGVYGSEDGGKTWNKLNEDRNLRQRAWYYSRIFADPVSEDVVYVVNVSYHKSKDGGKTFASYNANHGDHHDLWIDPSDARRMIIGDDGGAQVSYDGGENWSTYHNQPTAQFYRVTTDNHFPYRIYGAQQDNSTVRISHRSDGGGIGEDDWEPTAGCECGHIAIDPLNNDIVYGGCYGGIIKRFDHRTKFSRSIDVWPDFPLGHGAEDSRYRFQWNAPLFFSPHDPKKLYTASNHLHVTTNEGQSWKVISPDLTRNDSTKLKSSGGPITKDNTTVEYYCTIFAAAESPRVKDLLWVGSDDGLLHISKDGGAKWENITPSFLPKWIMINSIEPDPHQDGGCYVAGTMYKWGDYKPYLLKTNDYGETWQLITTGIDPEHFTRVIRADPTDPGTLYAGTESGMYVSFDDGKHWQDMQLNLPIVPITDLAIKNNNLIAATQGRSFWILDDLNQFRQTNTTPPSDIVFYKPTDTYRMTSGAASNLKAGTNYAGGLTAYYYLPDTLSSKDTMEITIMNANGDTLNNYSSVHSEKAYQLKPQKGMNKFNWNLRPKPAKKFEGMVIWGGNGAGAIGTPGNYNVVLKINDNEYRQPFKILKDPRSAATEKDYQLYTEFMTELSKKITEAHETIISIRDIRQQLNNYKVRVSDDKELKNEIEKIDSVMTRVEEGLYQTKNRSVQDPLNFPIRLTDKLAYVGTTSGNGEYPPTEQAYGVQKELLSLIDAEILIFEKVKREMLPIFNKMVKEKGIDAIILKKK